MKISPTSRFYDNTMLSTYKECPRKFLLRHILGWRSTGTSNALIFGLSWHSAMDAIWINAKQLANDRKELLHQGLLGFLATWTEQGMPAQPDIEQLEHLGLRNPMTAQDMLKNYIDTRWSILQEAELLAVEQPFAVPVPQMAGTWYIGRLDKVIKLNETLTVEHKTTTEYKKDGGFKSSYVESWYSDSQVKGYQFGGGLFFPNHSQVWVDAALVHKTVHNAFRFIPVAHQMPLLEEWIGDTKEWIGRIEIDKNLMGTKHRVFPKNESSCMGKYGPCTFLNICRTTPDPMKLDGPPEGYIEEFWRPFDLLNLDKIMDKD